LNTKTAITWKQLLQETALVAARFRPVSFSITWHVITENMD